MIIPKTKQNQQSIDLYKKNKRCKYFILIIIVHLVVSLIIQIAKKETEVKLKFQKVWFTELGIRIDLDMNKKVNVSTHEFGRCYHAFARISLLLLKAWRGDYLSTVYYYWLTIKTIYLPCLHTTMIHENRQHRFIHQKITSWKNRVTDCREHHRDVMEITF